MNITYDLVKKTRKMLSYNLHDQDWHEFMNHREVRAIVFALQDKEPGDTTKDLIIAAKSCLFATNS